MRKHSKTQFLSMAIWALKAAEAFPKMYFASQRVQISAVNAETGFVFGTFDMGSSTGTVQPELVNRVALDMPLDKWVEQVFSMFPEAEIKKDKGEGALFAYETSSVIPFARWDSPSNYVILR